MHLAAVKYFCRILFHCIAEYFCILLAAFAVLISCVIANVYHLNPLLFRSFAASTLYMEKLEVKTWRWGLGVSFPFRLSLVLSAGGACVWIQITQNKIHLSLSISLINFVQHTKLLQCIYEKATNESSTIQVKRAHILWHWHVVLCQKILVPISEQIWWFFHLRPDFVGGSAVKHMEWKSRLTGTEKSLLDFAHVKHRWVREYQTQQRKIHNTIPLLG